LSSGGFWHSLIATRARRRRLAVIILAVALLLRVGFVVHQRSYRPSGDAADFDRVALSLALHGRYPPSLIAPRGGPSAFRPPGYPYLLAAVYDLTGTAHSTSRFEVARIASALLSTGTVALVGLIACLLWGVGAVALGAMALAAVYPPLITLGDAMLSEPLFTLYVLAAVAAALLARRSPQRLRWPVLAGATVGLAALTRSNGIIVLPAIAAAVWRPSRREIRPLLSAGAVVAVALLVLAPWMIRDAAVFHRFVPISTEDGITLAGTYNAISMEHSAIWRPPVMAPYNALRRAGGNEAAIDARFASQALNFIGEHPADLLKAAFYNGIRLLDLEGPGLERGAAAESGIGFGTSDVDVYAFYALLALTLGALAVGGLARADVRLGGSPTACAEPGLRDRLHALPLADRSIPRAARRCWSRIPTRSIHPAGSCGSSAVHRHRIGDSDAVTLCGPPRPQSGSARSRPGGRVDHIGAQRARFTSAHSEPATRAP
jgi:hypothetical protein